MRPIERFSTSTFMVISGILADLIGAGTFLFSPPFRKFISEYTVLVFWTFFSLLLLLLILLESLSRKNKLLSEKLGDGIEFESKYNEECRKNSELERARLACVADISSLQNQLSEREGRISELERRLNPSAHDNRTFSAILDIFSWTGVMAFLDGFDGKTWWGNKTDPIYDFVGDYRECYFDDSLVNEAFQEFYQACNAFVNWMSSEGAPVDTPYSGEGNRDTMYRIATSGERGGDYAAFSATRSRGFEIVEQLTEQRRHLERIGRERGLSASGAAP